MEILEVPVADFVRKMENFSGNDMDERWHSGYYSGYSHKAPNYDQSLHGMLEDLKRSLAIVLTVYEMGTLQDPADSSMSKG